jgi:hypothetical protein
MELSREKALWAGVLIQAINDALHRSGFCAKDYTTRGEFRSPHAEALAWIKEGGADFCTVCQFVGLDPDAVRAAVLSGSIGPLHLAQDRPRAPKAKVQGKAA